MFVVMKIQPFKLEQSPDNIYRIPVEIKIEPGKMVGYLPVYDTREDALADYPNANLTEIREVKATQQPVRLKSHDNVFAGTQKNVSTGKEGAICLPRLKAAQIARPA